jgi:hypothetical protein
MAKEHLPRNPEAINSPPSTARFFCFLNLFIQSFKSCFITFLWCITS